MSPRATREARRLIQGSSSLSERARHANCFAHVSNCVKRDLLFLSQLAFATVELSLQHANFSFETTTYIYVYIYIYICMHACRCVCIYIYLSGGARFLICFTVPRAQPPGLLSVGAMATCLHCYCYYYYRYCYCYYYYYYDKISTKLGRRCSSAATCLIRPLLFYALLIVSRITVIGEIV